MHILLVEDNPGDAQMISDLVREGKSRHIIHHVSDGTEALEFLHRKGAYDQAPRPDLVFLDLNLPTFDGRKVLSEIKDDPDLATIPVVVLTTSGSEKDIDESYDKKANCYVTKPMDFAEFEKTIETITDFWFNTVRLPQTSPY